MAFNGAGLPFKKRDFYSLFYSPSAANSICEGFLLHTNSFSPLNNRLCFSFIFKQAVSAPIALLLLSCAPLAIIFRIAFTIVDPIKREIIGRLSHVRKKGFKRIKPFFANSNATPTIIFESSVIFIEAPLLHCTPNPISLRSRQSVKIKAFSHVGGAFRRKLGSYAATRTYFSVSNMVQSDKFFRSTTTHAVNVARAITAFIKDRQSPKNKTGNGFTNWHISPHILNPVIGVYHAGI